MPFELTPSTTQSNVQPFLRWAGGKRWFVKHLSSISNKFCFNRYHEPFLGSAVVFIHLQPKHKSYLSDLNAELVDTYLAVKEDVESVIGELKKLKNTKEDYYRIRQSKFRSESKKLHSLSI